MNPSINNAKLADLKAIVTKLYALPEDVRLYIVGYADGVLAMEQRQNLDTEQKQRESA